MEFLNQLAKVNGDHIRRNGISGEDHLKRLCTLFQGPQPAVLDEPQNLV